MKTDARITKTKIKLSQSLTELLNNKPLSEISVIDLVEQAHVNRSTFYLHYKSLSTFLDELEQDLYQQLEENLERFFDNTSWLAYLIHPGNQEILPIIEYILNEIHNNIQLKSFIEARKYNSEFLIQLVESGFKNAMKSVKHHYPNVNLTKFEYYYSFISIGFVGIIFTWVMNGLKESVQEVSNMLHSMIYQNLSVLSENS